MVSCTCAVEASSWRAMSGSDGRYISVVSGPIALNAASIAVSAKVPGRSMDGDYSKNRRDASAVSFGTP